MAALRIGGDPLWVECDPEAGFAVTGIIDAATGANALWQRTGFVPAEPQRTLGPSGDASIESFIDLFVGGWFEMFPTTGYPGTVQGAVGPAVSLLHGEAMRLPWTVTHRDASTVEATVDDGPDAVPAHATARDHRRRAGRVRACREPRRGDGPVRVGPPPVLQPGHLRRRPVRDRRRVGRGPGARVRRGAQLARGRGAVHVPARHRWSAVACATCGDPRGTPTAATSRRRSSFDAAESGSPRRGSVGRSASSGTSATSRTSSCGRTTRRTAPRSGGRATRSRWSRRSAPGRSLDDAVAAGAVRELAPGGSVSLTMRARWGAIDEVPAGR